MNKVQIVVNGQKFPEDIKIKRFDCRSINLSYEEGGGYMTTFPISDLDYRKKTPTNALVKVFVKEDHTLFHIVDDWGKAHRVEIPNHLTCEIAEAIESAKKYKLLYE